jgi:hypothetical protein
MVKPTTTVRSMNLFIVVSPSKTMNFDPRKLSIVLSLHRSHLFVVLFRSLDASAKFETDAWIERIAILGYPKNPTRVAINSGDKQAIPLHTYDDATHTLIIRRPGPPVTADWTLTLS